MHGDTNQKRNATDNPAAKLFSTEVACHANGTGPVRPVPMPRKRYGDRTGLSWPQNDEAAN
jgi:hypothetical protein